MGAVQNYQLVKGQVSPATDWSFSAISTQILSEASLSFTDTSIQPPDQDPDINPNGYRDTYLLCALYSQGASLPAVISDGTTNLSVALIHGPGSLMQLALFSFPTGTISIRMNLTTNSACGWGLGTNITFDIPLSAFVGSLYAFSDTEYPLYTAYTITAQAVIVSGFAGEPRLVEPDCGKTIRYPFLDAGPVLKDNVIFALQSCALAGPFRADFESLGWASWSNLEMGYGRVHK